MLQKIWRYSHFYLTVSSSLFLLLATITGAFLAFEPIQTKAQPFYVDQAENLALSNVVNNLTKTYEEVLDIEVDANHFVKATVFSMESDLDGQFYINPKNGKKLGAIPPKNAFFEFLTNFHRSLFLKTPGRVFVGIVCFLFFLIAITGLLLAIKRQGGIVAFFSKIVKDQSIQYNHVALGRLMLLPIVIIALSGTYLSMDRFSLLPKIQKQNLESKPATNQKEIPFAEFPVFQQTKLDEVRKLEFPFSTDEEDYFVLSLKDRALKIHQKTGAIVEETNYPFTQILQAYSFHLHTGSGSIFWSLVLFVSSLSILYFMYSGTVISIQRLRSKIKNKFTAHQANIVILIGSENGSTKRLAKTLLQSLLKANKKVFLDDLNNYQNYPNIEQLIILTATYGQGEPPSNAHLFLDKLQHTKIDRSFDCYVIGFGSFSYPKFCEFAKTIFKQTSAHPQINVPAETPLLIHNQNYKQFKNWAINWSQSLGIQLDLPTELAAKKTKETTFKIIDKEIVKDNYDETFTLTLALQKRKRFLPGDLLGIVPPNEASERLYSIGKNAKGDLLLSIKKHTHGICSNYLHQLKIGNKFNGTIQQNKEFHLPKTNKTVTLIANGTGIAPFLGMIHQPTKANLNLYWGTRTHSSFNLYKASILEAEQKGTLQQYNIAFSKEVTEYNYVQNLLARDENTIANSLKNGGYFMLCGSLNMRDAVFIQLEKICIKHGLPPFETYKNNGQILTDCY